MNPKILGVAAAALLLASGCAKKVQPPASVRLVPETERSRYFEAVNSHLELGGTLYGYVDVDGDALKAADELQRVLTQVAVFNPALAGVLAKTDFRQIALELGLDGVKAAGVSSVRGTDGVFRNREFFYTPQGRHGLLAVLGGPVGPFTRTRLAPPDADLYSECELDVAAAYDTIRKVSVEHGWAKSPDTFDAKLKDAGLRAGFSFLDALGALRGRMTIVARAEEGKSYDLPLPGGLKLPGFSVLVCLDGEGSVFEKALQKSDAWKASVEGSRRFYTLKSPLPIKGLSPVVAVEGSSLYAATSTAFLRECLDRQSGIEQNPDFQRLLADLGPTGNAVSFVTPRFFSALRATADLNREAPAPFRNLLDAALKLPPADHPMMAVRENLPDGILVRASYNRSLKRELAVAAVYNPVTIGVMAALVYQTSHLRAQTSPAPGPMAPPLSPALRDRRVLGNLRYLSFIANRYYRKNGVHTATLGDLVGPGKPYPLPRSWEGEDYGSIWFEKGLPLSVRTPDGRVITYPPPAEPVPAAPKP